MHTHTLSHMVDLAALGVVLMIAAHSSAHAKH